MTDSTPGIDYANRIAAALERADTLKATAAGILYRGALKREPITFTIIGAVQGALWWPIGELAQKSVRFTFTRAENTAPFVDSAADLAAAVDALLAREDGDFSNAGRLTADSLLLAERVSASGRRKISRWFELARFASIADRMTADYQFEEE